MGNLPARILTAAVLGGFVVYGILALPFVVMAGFVAVLMVLAAHEWARFAWLDRGVPHWLFVISTLVAGAALCHAALADPALARVVLVTAVAWWLLAATWIVVYQRREAPRVTSSVLLAACGWLALLPAATALLLLLARDPRLLLMVLGLIWSADTLAYFGGRALGRRKLANRVSPGKTWEGFAVALIGTPPLVMAAVHAAAITLPPGATALLVVAVLASVIGDLLESLLKRLRGIKDSGTLLPGHGGVLDRIDSVLAAVPVFTLGLIFLEHS